MIEIEDEFLSEEDRDLESLSEAELIVYWNLWLRQAQATNDLDEALYSHGVFERDPAVTGPPPGGGRGPKGPRDNNSSTEDAEAPFSQGARAQAYRGIPSECNAARRDASASECGSYSRADPKCCGDSQQ